MSTYGKAAAAFIFDSFDSSNHNIAVGAFCQTFLLKKRKRLLRIKLKVFCWGFGEGFLKSTVITETA
jgi:hypothetical protein